MGDEPARSAWVTARVTGIRRETRRATTFRLDLGAPSTHRPGQHLVVRLTAPDGYRASRSYSIASAPDGSPVVDITVERLVDGEVSGFLHDVVEVGDELEVRGPIGRFTWDGASPALLVGGGSGLVPLMAMLRHARRTGQSGLVRLVVSARDAGEVLYRDELPGPEVTVVLTRATSGPMGRPPGRLATADVQPVVTDGATAFVCGSSGFTTHVTGLLRGLGVTDDRIRVERFGPTAPDEAPPAT